MDRSCSTYPAMSMLSMTVAPTAIPASSPTCKTNNVLNFVSFHKLLDSVYHYCLSHKILWSKEGEKTPSDTLITYGSPFTNIKSKVLCFSIMQTVEWVLTCRNIKIDFLYIITPNQLSCAAVDVICIFWTWFLVLLR